MKRNLLGALTRILSAYANFERLREF